VRGTVSRKHLKVGRFVEASGSWSGIGRRTRPLWLGLRVQVSNHFLFDKNNILTDSEFLGAAGIGLMI